jgi:hypothetical protein
VDGFEVAREKIDIFFPERRADQHVEDFSLGYVDGQTKMMICFLIVTLVESEGLTPDEINSSKLAATLMSFRSIQANYQHFERPDHHIMEALSANHNYCKRFAF